MVWPEDSPKLQVLLPFLWWGTFNIWSAIQKGKKDTFQSKYSHSKQNKPKRYTYNNPEVIGYNWNHKSAQRKHKDFQLIVNSWPIMGQRGCSSELRDWNGGHLLSLREGILHHISFKSPYLQKRLRRWGWGMGEVNASWFPFKLIRCTCSIEGRGILLQEVQIEGLRGNRKKRGKTVLGQSDSPR